MLFIKFKKIYVFGREGRGGRPKFYELRVPTLFGVVACRILVPQPGIKPVPPAVEAWSLNHWTAREVPGSQPFFISASTYHHLKNDLFFICFIVCLPHLR